MNSKLWGAVSIFISIVVLFILYGEVLVHPDSFLFSSGVDAVKNYFTFAWHVKYDNNWLHFGGSNYPFGEHVCFTDGHPIISLLIGSFNFVKEYPVGTLNILMLASQIFGVCILYLLLVKIGCLRVVSAVGALSMVWLQPNMYRILGHFSLSHVWVIPLAILFLHKMWNNNTWKIAMLFCVYIFIIFFLHPYYGMMISLIPFCFGIVDFIWGIYKKHISVSSLRFVLAGFSAPLAYLLFLYFTDSHINRPEKSVGFLLYTSGIDDILVPTNPPFRHFMCQIIKVDGQQWEGSAYIGLATMLVLVIYFFISIMRIKKIDFGIQTFWRTLLPSSFIILLFAFGFPFYLKLEHWLEVIPFIEQFRAPGRFSWVFYFTLVPFAFFIFSNWVEYIWKNNHKLIAWLLCVLIFCLFISEGYVGQVSTARAAQYNKNIFTNTIDNRIIENLRNLELQKSNAIIPVPFFHYGTDFLYRNSDNLSQQLSYSLSFISGKPLFATSNPRVSFTETGNSLGFFSPPFSNRTILNQFGINDNLYVFYTGENSETQNNWYLPSRKKTYSILKEKKFYYQFRRAIRSNDVSLIINLMNNYYSDDNRHNYSVSIQKTDYEKFNIGAKQVKTLIQFDPGQLESNTEYEASICLYAQDIFKLKAALCLNEEGINKKYKKRVNLYETFHYFGDSAILVLHFTVKDSLYKYNLALEGDNDNKINYKYGTLIIRKRNELIIEEDSIKSKKKIIKINNFTI